jgi:hypothetical protein
MDADTTNAPEYQHGRRAYSIEEIRAMQPGELAAMLPNADRVIGHLLADTAERLATDESEAA